MAGGSALHPFEVLVSHDYWYGLTIWILVADLADTACFRLSSF